MRPSDLRESQRVIFTGLVARPDLNGLEGIVLFAVKERHAVRCTTTGEEVKVRASNLLAGVQLNEHLGQDGLECCLRCVRPCDMLGARLVCEQWRSLLTQTFTNTEWQAEHLPVAVLCRAASWEATLLRIERVPEEAGLSMHDFTKLGSKTPYLRLLCCEADDEEFDYFFEGENREDKMHPLFLALAHGAPDEVVRAIIQPCQPSLFQEGTALVDADENAPLAFAVIHGRPPSTLSLLLSCQPTAVAATDRMGYAPLHHAALARDPDAIRLLLAASTAEAREATEDGALPLHLLARGPAGESQRLTPPVDESRALAACELLLDAYPAALDEERDISIGVTRGERKMAPLHLAAKFDAPTPLLLRLLEAAPHMAARKDGAGRFPAHYLAGSYATDHTAPALAALLEHHPPNEEWPLRDLLRLGACAEIYTLARLQAHPQEASEPDPPPTNTLPNRPSGRAYPLHYAANRAAPARVVARLLELCPQAARAFDSHGNFPIHLAACAAGQLSRSVWGAMVRRRPPAQSVRDAAAAGCRLLLEAWPESGEACDRFVGVGAPRDEQNDRLGRWPLHLALNCHAPDSVLDVLRTRTPCDAFGNPTRRWPRRKGMMTKVNAADVRKLTRAGPLSLRLRYLCSGARGDPEDLCLGGDKFGTIIYPSRDGGDDDPSLHETMSLETVVERRVRQQLAAASIS